MKYRKLKKYKYQLMRDYEYKTNIVLEHCIKTDFVSLYSDGHLKIEKGYAWDGPSGPTIDTKTFMRGSLVHDALYQLMREGLDYKYRQYADNLLYSICREDGMCRFRAWYVRLAVRLFAGANARYHSS